MIEHSLRTEPATVTQWYRRHVNGWIARALPVENDQWGYGVATQMAFTPQGAASSRADALRAADALIPSHVCNDETCDGWHEVVIF